MDLTARDRGLGHATRIEREIADPADWKAALEAIADPDERAVAREYLRGVWIRLETIRRLRKPTPGTRASRIPPECLPDADPDT